MTESTSFSAESYFVTQPPPTTLENDVHRVREWTQKQVAAGRRVVLVTVSIKVFKFCQAHTLIHILCPTLERRYYRTSGAQCVSGSLKRKQSTIPDRDFVDLTLRVPMTPVFGSSTILVLVRNDPLTFCFTTMQSSI